MIGKGLFMLATTAAIATAVSSGPVLSVTAPLFWWGTKTYKVGALAACGIATALSLGKATGHVMGETASVATIHGASELSHQLAERLKQAKDESKKS